MAIQNLFLFIIISCLTNDIFCTNTIENMQAINFFSMSNTPTWHDYSIRNIPCTLQKEKWVWKHSFMVKTKKPIFFKEIHLIWDGPSLQTTLVPSLFKKKEKATTLCPIKKNLICYGKWDPCKQHIVFPLEQKLIAVNYFHVVISFPSNAEMKLKQGTFHVKLPE